MLHFRCKCVLTTRFQALYNYMPRNEDELELKEGDIVDVMEKCDDGWFVGKYGHGACFTTSRHCSTRNIYCLEQMLLKEIE